MNMSLIAVHSVSSAHLVKVLPNNNVQMEIDQVAFDKPITHSQFSKSWLYPLKYSYDVLLFMGTPSVVVLTDDV